MLLSAVHSSETETTEQYEHLQAPSTYKKNTAHGAVAYVELLGEDM